MSQTVFPYRGISVNPLYRLFLRPASALLNKPIPHQEQKGHRIRTFLHERNILMTIGIQVKYLWTRRLGVRLVLLSLFFGGVAGCAPMGTSPVDLATPTPLSMPSPAAPVEATLPSGWETYASQG
jgi:hypothetical protein